jgi:hypothetical protein
VRRPPCLVCTNKGGRVAWRPGECARANGHAAATRRLGITSSTGAAMGAIYAGGAKEPATEDEQT